MVDVLSGWAAEEGIRLGKHAAFRAYRTIARPFVDGKQMDDANMNGRLDQNSPQFFNQRGVRRMRWPARESLSAEAADWS